MANEQHGSAAALSEQVVADRAFLEKLQADMRQLREQHPHWHADFDDLDPFVAERRHVEHLLQTAPTEWARGLLTGIMMFRQQIAAVTGRGF